MEERELPVGWSQAPLGEVCRLLNGRAYSKDELLSDGKYPLLRVGNLFTNPHWYYSDLELEPDKYCDKGDLLYAWSASFGPHVWQGPKVIYHYHIWKVEHLEDLIARDFLRAFFQWDTEAIKREQGSGSTMLHVTKKSMEARLIPVPPQAEQRRIASKLDTTLTAVDSCRQRLEGMATLIKRFRQAVLEAATTGELTREWRNGKEMTTQEATIQELCKDQKNSLCIGPFGSNLKVSDYADAGVPLIFVREVRARSFGGSGTKFVSHQKAVELAAHVASPGDLLMTKMGDPPGDTAVYPDHMPHAIITSDVVCMRPDPSKICKFFLSYLLESPGGRDRIEEITAGVAQQKISLERFRKMTLSVPPLQEQHEIVRRAQQLFSLADQLEAKLTAARQVAERLTPALLAKAFRGELVPQDPCDEPASVLLERIRAARQAESGAGKPSRRGRRSAAATPAPGVADAAPAPPDLLATLLRECGALSHKALLAASELEPDRFEAQRELERQAGRIRQLWEDGEALWEAVG